MALTAEEDADLRRLESFERTGFLTTDGLERLNELRERDRRSDVRPVEDNETAGTAPHLGRPPRLADCWAYPAS
jgi:hypothetical protein